MTGLYVHIPFCSVKCFYCDFAAFSGQGRQAERYLSALEREAVLRGVQNPRTLYVGGGTPSELNAGQITALFAGLRRGIAGADFSEITFEGNPESLDDEKLDVLRGEGVTRLSIGLQTADDALLKSIGRRHTSADFRRVFFSARIRAIKTLSVDLMFGLPGQTLDSWRRTLDFVLALEPEHISLYGLQVEDRTLFGRRGVEENSPESRDMYELAINSLGAAGFDHYEISNFARPGHRSRHNINYWERGDYVGLGCSAASFQNGVRSSNAERLADYMNAVEAGRIPVAESENPQGAEAVAEEAFLGLRMIEGFLPSKILREAFCDVWNNLKSRGLATDEGGRWRLTSDGIFFANDAFREFVPPFKGALSL